MNPNYITSIFKYFSKFIPKSVLTDIFRQPSASQLPGYAELMAEILAFPDNNRIPSIGAFIVSANEKFVSDKVSNAKGILLYIEYGSLSFDPGIPNGITEKLALSVVREYNIANSDNLNEALLMNECNNILSGILTTLQADQEALDFCGNHQLIKFPAEILPVQPQSFYDRSGWCAFFDNSTTLL